MASRSLGTLTLDLIAKIGGFVEGLTKAERETTKRTQAMQKQLRDLKDEAVDLGKAGAAAFAAIVAGAAAMGVAFYRSGSESVDALAKMSDQIGIATEDLGALRYAAQQMSGMAEGTFDVSLRRMTRRITEAADGAGPAVGALKSLRLEAGELARMSPDQQFRAIADAMKEIPTQGERLRATMAIFDTEGVPLINTLMQGSEAIGELEERAHSLGLTISRVDAAQVEAANNALAESAATMAAFQQQLAVQFAPVVKAATDLITGMSGELGGMDSVAERVFNNVISGMAFLADATDGASRVFKIFSATGIGTFSQMVHRVLGGIDMILFGYQQLAEVFGLDTIASGIGALRDFGVLSGEIAAQAAADIDRMLSEELAGSKFKRFVADAREAGREAAEALVGTGVIDVPEMPGLPEADSGMSEKEREAIGRRLDTLRESFYTEQQLLGAKYVEEQRLLDEALALRQEALAKADLTEAQRLAEGAALEEEVSQLRIQSLRRYELELSKLQSKSAWDRWLESAYSAFTDFDSMMTEVANRFTSSFGSAFERVITDSQSASDAFRDLGEAIVRSVINSIGQMIAQWGLYHTAMLLMGRNSEAAAIAGAGVTGSAIAAAYAPAAAMASLASFGGNSAPATTGIFATVTAAKSVSFAGLFDKGGTIPSGQWGIVGEYGPEIVEGPAQVTSRTESAKLLSGGGLTVNVYNAPQGTEVSERQVDGRRVIDILIADLRAGGRSASAIQETFGVTRRGR